ncbi:transposase [Sorangium sp. So ce375]|uniref:transposase n=1 Tax=Sorangium sp. So ce375 TaxID=3133306 RepID=UPI003F5B4D80
MHTTGLARKSAELFCELLRLLAERYADATRTHLVVDNYGIHSARATRRVLDELGGRNLLHFLPPYCPDANRIERLWQDLHANVTCNHRCRTMKALLSNTRDYLDGYVWRRADCVILSTPRWLRFVPGGRVPSRAQLLEHVGRIMKHTHALERLVKLQPASPTTSRQVNRSGSTRSAYSGAFGDLPHRRTPPASRDGREPRELPPRVPLLRRRGGGRRGRRRIVVNAAGAPGAVVARVPGGWPK